MRILHTSEFYAPSVGGAQEVVRQISERLVARGHSVTVATARLRDRQSTTINGVRIEEFAIRGNSVRGLSGELDRYRRFLLDGQFDVMLNYAAQQWTADLAFEVLDDLAYRTVLAPCGLSGLQNRAYNSYLARLPKVMAGYDHLVLHSSTYQDARFIVDAGLTHWSVIPNGASEEEFGVRRPNLRAKFSIDSDEPLLLTVGSHTGLKGHALTLEAFRRARIGRAVLIVNGNRATYTLGCLPQCWIQARLTELSSFGQKRVLLLDLARNDLVAAFQAADLFVFGSSVECAPIVLYEAMAAGTPFLTIDCGNALEIAKLGGGEVLPTRKRSNGMSTSNPSLMAQRIESLLGDGSARRAMSSAGKSAWRAHLTWDRVTDQYERLYHRLVNEESVGATQ